MRQTDVRAFPSGCASGRAVGRGTGGATAILGRSGPNYLAVFLTAAVLFLARGAAAEEEKKDVAPAPEVSARIEQAVDRAVPYLLGRQRPDGSITEGQYPTAMTALSVMALCAVGHLPSDQNKEGEAIRKALAYILADGRMDGNGYYGGDGGRMYGHGITCLMLAEVLAMSPDEKQDKLVRKRLEKGIGLILWSQERKAPGNPHYGGWRYEPPAGDSDLSVTIWHLLALRAAKNAGMDVPKKAIDAAIDYLKRSYSSPRDGSGRPTNLKSACAYQPGGGPSYAMGAAGLLALQVCGQYDSPEVCGSADWLTTQNLDVNQPFFFYGTYYYAQGMYQRGGLYAETAAKSVADVLLKHQQPDGGWQASNGQEAGVGRVYATSMALLSLSVQYHFLPIYQR